MKEGIMLFIFALAGLLLSLIAAEIQTRDNVSFAKRIPTTIIVVIFAILLIIALVKTITT